jgi:transposase, IS6 family
VLAPVRRYRARRAGGVAGALGCGQDPGGAASPRGVPSWRTEIGKLQWAGGCRAVEEVATSASTPAPSCVRCCGIAVKKDGRRFVSGQRFRCHGCRRTSTARTGTPFAGHRWPLEVITTAVRWYFRYRLSADVRDLLADRGSTSPPGGLARAHKLGPLLAAAGRRHARAVGARWYADETSVRVGGRWAYLGRAVDEHGQVVDVLLRAQRDLASARAVFDQTIIRRGIRPRVVVTDKHPASRRAVRRRTWRATHVRTGLHRARGETTKAIERSHVPIKDRLRPTRGLQSTATGQRLLEGIESAHALWRGDIRLTTRPDPTPAPARGAGARTHGRGRGRHHVVGEAPEAARLTASASNRGRVVNLSLARQHTSASRPPMSAGLLLLVLMLVCLTATALAGTLLAVVVVAGEAAWPAVVFTAADAVAARARVAAAASCPDAADKPRRGQR